MISILSAINIEATRANAKEMYNKYVIDSKIISGKDLSAEAFDVDIKKEFRDKSISLSDRNYPLYICEKDQRKYYIIPVVGTGLWGPIWVLSPWSLISELYMGLTLITKRNTWFRS